MNRMSTRLRTVIAPLLAVAGTCTGVSAETITVCLDGSCDHTSVQAAIDAAANGDVIEVAPGYYTVDQAIDTAGKALTVRGTTDSSGGPATILDGQGSSQVLRCTSAEGPTTVLESLVIRGGFATQGGGMYCDGTSPSIVNCTFTNNSATSGGAMFNIRNSSPTIDDCRFTGNAASYRGGGMYNVDGSSPTLTDTSFTNNTATDRGGGMFNFAGSSPHVDRCTFTKNLAISGGGGMANGNSAPTITDSTFTFNSTSGSGGGMFNSSGGFDDQDVTIIGCTFTGNTADIGGGIRNNFAVANLTDTFVCENLPDQIDGLYFCNTGNCINGSCTRCAHCPGDFGGDGEVGAEDLTILLAEWDCTGPDCSADLDGDGTVDSFDLTIFLCNWGSCG